MSVSNICVGIYPSSRQNSERWGRPWTCFVNSSTWGVGISALPEAESCTTQRIWIQLEQNCKHSATGYSSFFMWLL